MPNMTIEILPSGRLGGLAALGAIPNADAVSAQLDKVVAAARQAILLMRGKAALVPAAAAAQPTLLDAVLGPIGVLMQTARAYIAFDETTGSVNGALDNMSKLVDKFDTTDRADVLAGNLAPEKWLAGMQSIQEGIYALGEGLADNDPATILWNQIQDAKNQLSKLGVAVVGGLGDTLSWLKWALPLTLAGGIGIALLLNPASSAAITAAGTVTKKALSGASVPSRRRSRRRRSRR